MHNQERPYAAQKSLRDLRRDVVQRRAHKQMRLCKAVVQHDCPKPQRTTTRPCAHKAHNLRAQPSAQPRSKDFFFNTIQYPYPFFCGGGLCIGIPKTRRKKTRGRGTYFALNRKKKRIRNRHLLLLKGSPPPICGLL